MNGNDARRELEIVAAVAKMASDTLALRDHIARIEAGNMALQAEVQRLRAEIARGGREILAEDLSANVPPD